MTLGFPFSSAIWAARKRSAIVATNPRLSSIGRPDRAAAAIRESFSMRLTCVPTCTCNHVHVSFRHNLGHDGQASLATRAVKQLQALEAKTLK